MLIAESCSMYSMVLYGCIQIFFTVEGYLYGLKVSALLLTNTNNASMNIIVYSSHARDSPAIELAGNKLAHFQTN